MSHSTNGGFKLPPIVSERGREFAASVAGDALPDRQSRASGVGHSLTAVARPFPARLDEPARLWLPFTVGVGQ
jgi:hypothetical protein